MYSKKIFIVFFLSLIIIGSFFNHCLAQTGDTYNIDTTAKAIGLSKSDIPTTAGTVMGIVLSFIGVLFFALMIFGGFMWMTAKGNEEQTKKALNIITAAVIGLVLVVSAYTITKFLFTNIGI